MFFITMCSVFGPRQSIFECFYVSYYKLQSLYAQGLTKNSACVDLKHQLSVSIIIGRGRTSGLCFAVTPIWCPTFPFTFLYWNINLQFQSFVCSSRKATQGAWPLCPLLTSWPPGYGSFLLSFSFQQPFFLPILPIFLSSSSSSSLGSSVSNVSSNELFWTFGFYFFVFLCCFTGCSVHHRSPILHHAWAVNTTEDFSAVSYLVFNGSVLSHKSMMISKIQKSVSWTLF